MAAVDWGMLCTDAVFLFSVKIPEPRGECWEGAFHWQGLVLLPFGERLGFCGNRLSCAAGKGSRDLRSGPGEPREVPQFPVPGAAPGSGQSWEENSVGAALRRSWGPRG